MRFRSVFSSCMLGLTCATPSQPRCTCAGYLQPHMHFPGWMSIPTSNVLSGQLHNYLSFARHRFRLCSNCPFASTDRCGTQAASLRHFHHSTCKYSRGGPVDRYNSKPTSIARYKVLSQGLKASKKRTGCYHNSMLWFSLRHEVITSPLSRSCYYRVV